MEQYEAVLATDGSVHVSTIDTAGSKGDAGSATPYFSRGRYWKNVLVVCTSFMFNFSAFSALMNLQSSLNFSEALGVTSLCAVYVCAFISSLLSPLFIWLLGLKWTVVLCSMFYVLYTVSNIYPVNFTLIPAGAVLGIGLAPYWTAAETYITTSAHQLSAAKSGKPIPEIIINRFNGIFMFFFRSGQVWGNLISSLVLRSSSTTWMNSDDDPKYNSTSATTLAWSACGRHSCGSSISFDLAEDGETHVAQGQTLLLIIIYTILGLIATGIIIVLLDPLPRPPTSSGKGEHARRKSFSQHLTSTFQLMRDPSLFLLIPLLAFTGMEQAFIFADFTKAYVTCTLGTSNVGFIMIGFGVSSAVFSAIFGQLEKYIGRVSIFVLGGVSNMGLLVVFDWWNPEGEGPAGVYWQLVLMAVGWGVGDAVLHTQISSILGVLFPDAQEPAFANFLFWQAIGFTLTFGLSIPSSVCIQHKLYGLMAFVAFALLCYLMNEYLISRRPRPKIEGNPLDHRASSYKSLPLEEKPCSS